MGDSEKLSILSSVLFTRNVILRCFCGIYLAAFLSFYIQAEGLFSHVNGVLPPQVNPVTGTFAHDKFASFLERPSWIRILKLFSIATFPAIELVSLTGSLIAFFGFVSSRFCILPIFTILWTLYYSLVDITGPFHQQSDDLLLEAGVICILLAPGLCARRYGVSDNVMFQLMRWLLFRFLFASGSVKLASGCPHWWNLSALKHHLLTLPMPTNLAFYSFYIPEQYLQLTTIFVNLSEMMCPWLFFAPVRSLRIFAFYWQLFLQLCIIGTGNYGFINFLIIVMLLSLLDDSHFRSSEPGTGINYKKVFSFILTMGATFFMMVMTMSVYKIAFENGKLVTDILVTKETFMGLIRQMIKLAPFVVTISIINVFLQSCISHPNIASTKGFFAKLSKIIHLLALTMVAISLVGVSTVPHGSLHPETNIANTSIGKAYDEFFNKFHIVHDYGQHMRKMRSERLELGFHYTHSDATDKAKLNKWQEYDVTYRPVNKNSSMPYAGLFFSRIDFKFYDAVGNGAKLEKNLWLAVLAKHLLRNNRAALMLLGHQNILKLKLPPTHVRIAFMRVNYVPREDSDKNGGLWTRKILSSSYLPPLSLTSNELDTLVKKIIPTMKREKEAYPSMLELLRNIRLFFEVADGHLVVNSILIASLVIMLRLKRR